MQKVNLNEWLKKTAVFKGQYQDVRQRLVCTDETTLSVQASEYHFCSPRKSYMDFNGNCEPDYFDYSTVEVWCVSCNPPEEWKDYGDQEKYPYAYIPVQMVEDFIAEHGGIKE